MDKQLEHAKQAYDNIEIPEELSAMMQQAIERGKLHRKRKRTRNSWIKRASAFAAAVFALFTISVNTMPAFASSLQDIPGLGKLVKILQFNQGSAGGGTIQDGTDVNFITLNKQGNAESIILNFTQNNQIQQVANSFNVKFTEYPNTMTFAVGGARKFSAVKDFETLRQSNYIQDAYEIISLDDSLIRFNVTFKESVAYEVKEYKDPAQVVITLTPNAKSNVDRAPIYSLRSASYPYGEVLGSLEEQLFGLESVRMLKDRHGTYFVEAGYYKTEAEALVQMKQIKEQFGIEEPLYIEKRDYTQIPESITAQQ